MTEREEVVLLARSWIGTPYRHQGSCSQAGADCLGLIRGIWRSLYGSEPEAPGSYSADWAETGHDEALWQAALRHLVPLGPDEPFRAGQVLLFRMRPRAVAKHVGLLSARAPLRFIHAYSGHGVVENTLSSPWRARLVARFDFPDVR
ncbi:NlpC/P60 family protein [Thioclava sp. GXIMD2076]|uniref:NlpC/P60 family protein n=1 Tax=Thioclava sp. GXIMD2076 TaxID=3131931 RepID=UPI0030D5AD6E